MTSRLSDHHFTMPEASVFGWEDPFYDEPGCRVCGKPIATAELCAECAKGNDPFVQSKYTQGRNH